MSVVKWSVFLSFDLFIHDYRLLSVEVVLLQGLGRLVEVPLSNVTRGFDLFFRRQGMLVLCKVVEVR